VYSPFAKHNIWFYFCVFGISASVLEDKGFLFACGMFKKVSYIFLPKTAQLNRRAEISPQQEQRRGS
jgi:hypothetical protein